jgi:electron transport complex protein RnfD
LTGLLNVAAPPHLRSRHTYQRVVWVVVLALMPAFIYGLAIFGVRAALVTGSSILACVASEALFQLSRRQKVTIADGSAFLTGFLLALNLPPAVPLWLPIVGGFFAVIVVKQLFGGLGHNLFNPALAARAFLLISWPGLMTTGWLPPSGGTLSGLDSVTGATPLTILKSPFLYGDPVSVLNQLNGWPALRHVFFGNIGGCIGETSALLLLIGGLFLLITGIADYRIVLGYFAGFMLFGLLLLNRVNIGFSVFTGGLMLGALFMATDWVTSPVTRNGRWIFGAGCGVLTVLFRRWGAYPEGVSFAILIMNMFTPLLDRLTRERIFGSRKESIK